MSVKLEITAEDIKRAIKSRRDKTQSRTETCPVSRAAQRIWPEARVSKEAVFPDGFTGFLGNRRLTMPQKAKDFVWAFDGGLSVQPFSFWV